MEDQGIRRHCNAIYKQNKIDRWIKGCILPFPKKGNLRIAKNYRGITFISIAAKMYATTENWKLRKWLSPNILTIGPILEGVRSKTIGATILFVDFSKAFDSIHGGKMEQILRPPPKYRYRFKERNGFKLPKQRNRRYPAQTITDVNYADDIALLANTPALAESLLQSLERAEGDRGLQANADKNQFNPIVIVLQVNSSWIKPLPPFSLLIKRHSVF